MLWVFTIMDVGIPRFDSIVTIFIFVITNSWEECDQSHGVKGSGPRIIHTGEAILLAMSIQIKNLDDKG